MWPHWMIWIKVESYRLDLFGMNNSRTDIYCFFLFFLHVCVEQTISCFLEVVTCISQFVVMSIQVSGSGPTQRALSSFSSGSAGAPAPSPDLSTAPPSTGSSGVQAQTVRGGGTYTQHSGFKYCFREVRDGQVRGAREEEEGWPDAFTCHLK